MQQQKTYGLITSQNQGVKCRRCYHYFGFKQKFDFYICCMPFKLSKILCQYHRTSCKCEQCQSAEANISVNLQCLDKLYLKKIQFQSITPNPQNFIRLPNNQSQASCCLCYRKFSSHNQLYLHPLCQKTSCYVCLYMVFSLQIKMFGEKDHEIKSKYKLVMKCCDQEGETIDKVEKCFSQSVCVFCGRAASFCESVIKLKNSFMFCLKCYFGQLQKEGDFEGFVWKVIDLITEIHPKNCLYCERQIKLAIGMSSYQINAFNQQLCTGCHPKKGQNLKEVYTILKSYKSPLVEKFDSKCCQCGQMVVTIQRKEKSAHQSRYVTELMLVYWKDGKIYCGSCLYFKYEELRTKFEEKQLKMNFFSTDIQTFEAIKQSYQNHFANQCMICSLPQTFESTLIKVKEGKGKFKNKLSCKYCKQCAGYFEKDIKKFKQLINIKREIHQRESYGPEDQNKQILKTISEVDTSGCFIRLFTKAINQIIKTPQNFIKQIKQITVPEGDKDVYYQARQHEDEEIFEAPTEEQQNLNKYALRVDTARIRSERAKDTLIGANDTSNTQFDEFGWLKLEQFESLQEISKNTSKQNIFSRKEQTISDLSYQVTKYLLDSDIIKQIEGVSLPERSKSIIQSLARQKCKVFSCQNLTQVIRQSQRNSNRTNQVIQRNQVKTKTNDKRIDDSPLMLGLMCSGCFVRYLLGIVKEQDIDKEDWNKALQRQIQIAKKIQKR